MSLAAAAPISTTERIDFVDALRGIAVGGILIGNLQWFSGYGFMPPDLVASTPAYDQTVRFLVHFFVEGKFYSIFSLLFGFGFAMQMAKAVERGDTKLSVFKRRLFWLLVIGVLHAVFLWYGDILVLYALLGFVLLLFRHKTEEQLLKWVVILISAPVVVYIIFLALFIAFAPPDVEAQVAASQAGMWANTLSIVSSGSYIDILTQFNPGMNVGRWAGLIFQMRLPKVFAMFLLGVYVYKLGYLHDLAANRIFIRKVMIYGLGLGLIGNGVFAAFANSESDLPPTWNGLVGIIAYAIGVPSLALGIAALFATLWQKSSIQKLLAVLAPVGRMALTNYLLQTAICVTIFYGFGFGLFGKLDSLITTLVGAAIFTAQMILSSIWLRYFRFGPIEWIWRQLTYGKRIPLRQ